MAIEITPNTADVFAEQIARVRDELDRGEADPSQADLGVLLAHVSALAIVNAELTSALLRERFNSETE